jgi:hypothetical protein
MHLLRAPVAFIVETKIGQKEGIDDPKIPHCSIFVAMVMPKLALLLV